MTALHVALALSGLASLVLSATILLAAPTPAPTNTDQWVYVCSAKKNVLGPISLYRLSPSAGTLTFVRVVAETHYPNFLALHPNGKTLYVTADNNKVGYVESYAIDAATGSLHHLTTQPSMGEHAVHVSISPDGKTALAANYIGNTVAALPIAADGSVLPATSVLTHTGSSVNKDRQDHPYLHSIYPDPTSHFAFSCDLGTDHLHCYKLDTTTSTLALNAPDSVTTPPGTGPRHLTFSPDGKFVYLVTEMGNSLIGYHYDSTNGSLTEIQTLSTLPPDVEQTPSVKAAEVIVTTNGRFVYVTNRGHETIAIFSRDTTTGLFKLLGYQSVRGKGPRYFGLDATGHFLLVTNQDTNDLVLFRLDNDGATLTPIGQPLPLPVPVCAVFLPVAP